MNIVSISVMFMASVAGEGRPRQALNPRPPGESCGLTTSKSQVQNTKEDGLMTFTFHSTF